MKIALDVSPISKSSTSAHKVRGVGAYINMLIDNLKKIDNKNKYLFVEDKKFPSDIDLIHYPYFDPFFKTLPFTSKNFVVTVHDLTPLVFPEHFPAGVKGKINWQIQKTLLKRVSKIVTDSECSARDVERIVGVASQKVKTVYLAADKHFKQISDEKSLTKITEKYNLPKEFLLYVGDATWNKNLPRLIEAVKKTKHKLVIVGKVWETVDINPNPWNYDLKQVLTSIADDKQFINLGFVPDEDIVGIYNVATVLIMPSIYEGFGLPVLEAMSCATPVISSRGGSLPEVGGDAVYYVDQQNTENISSGINKVFEDKKLQMELSKKGLKQAEKFTIKKSIEDLVGVYESAI